MKILYVGLHYLDGDEPYLLSICKNGISVAHHIFQRNIIEGLEKKCSVSLITALPVGSFPIRCRKIQFETKNKENHVQVGYLNVPVLKGISQRNAVKKNVCEWILKNKEDEKVIVVYDAHISFLKAVTDARELCGDPKCKLVIIIPDLPGKYSIEYLNYGKITRSWLKSNERKFYKLSRKLDGYVLLTKHMKEVLFKEGGGNKPYMVLEGLVNSASVMAHNVEQNFPNKKKVIFYAGELAKTVGINILLDAFAGIDNPDYELWICGSGDMRDAIIDRASRDHRIKYHGFVPKQRLSIMEREVDVYVNPRQNICEYTRYSFPSKNLEYLKTGKPLIAYKLDGIPDDYDQVIFYPDDYTVEALREKIIELCSIDYHSLCDISQKQYDFCLTKSEIIQGNRMIAFFEDVINQ